MILRTLTITFSLLAAPAFADLKSCQHLYEIAPRVLSDLNQVGSAQYEDEHPGLGYSVSFADPSSKLTLFFYDLQHKVIPPDAALESFKQSARDIVTVTGQRGAELGEINAYEMRDTSQVLPLRAEAESSDGFAEMLALGVVDNCIVKMRLTAQFSLDEAKVWVKAIADYLNEGFQKPT